MNVFASYSCPKESAAFLDRVRRNKMIIESTQILCTALRFHGCKDESIYKATHSKHPCVIWAGKRGNYRWLLDHVFALNELYKQESGKDHKSFALYQKCVKYAKYIPIGESQFENCTRSARYGLDYTEVYHIHHAYKAYIVGKWLNENTEKTKMLAKLKREIAGYSQRKLESLIKTLSRGIQENSFSASKAVRTTQSMTKTLLKLDDCRQTSAVKAKIRTITNLFSSVTKAISIFSNNIRTLIGLLKLCLIAMSNKKIDAHRKKIRILQEEIRLWEAA